MKPTPEMFENSVEAFFEVLKKYDPDVIFVWGKRLWKKLPDEDFSDGKKIINESNGFYEIGGKKIRIFVVNHPSSGFDKKHWTKFIKKVMSVI
jgi:ABC-type Fe3+-hydroxamate transport system substrate-binding protein